ncbi:hypothetical protein CY34DRAFT_19759 [Suillus luteus UH-Slu-Lm8-n1]|uniref:Uncharacterized protein n=1 Tax=Suillus luteus UH-Slu-Lm8-n1 TaxID=930992 RepID=A0A0C9Z2B6_9AGAM|nr:hypothetical protein CY34DRAFT_19759 [Suillus luteus UH-Slu-Lm8-n1]
MRPRPRPASLARVSPTPRLRPARPALLPPLPASQYSDGATHEEDEVEVDELFGTQGSKVEHAV